jgi:hypothetical protein
MKRLVTNYIFDASAQQVIFPGYSSISRDGLLLITNVTDNIIIYNFASSTLGGTVSGNTLSLTYNTTSMDDSDDIQIFYDDGPEYEDETHGELGLRSTGVTDRDVINSLTEILEELREIKEMWMEVL